MKADGVQVAKESFKFHDKKGVLDGKTEYLYVQSGKRGSMKHKKKLSGGP
jgi:hypothetical protein